MLEVAGVRDILTKSMGSANVLNVVMATFDALDGLRPPALEAARRGKRAEELRVHRIAFILMAAFLIAAPLFVYPVFMMKVWRRGTRAQSRASGSHVSLTWTTPSLSSGSHGP